MAEFPSPVEWREALGFRPFTVGWAAISHAIRGLPLSDAERAAFLHMSGGVEPQQGGSTDLLVLKPRRSGGSDWLAWEMIYEARFGGHEVAFAPGQIGTIPMICARLDQCDELMGYARGIIEHPTVRRHVASSNATEIVFKNRIRLRGSVPEINAGSSITVPSSAFDEFSKWPHDGAAQPDRLIDETFAAARLPLVGAPPRRVLRVTSFFIQSGRAYETDQKYFGLADAPTLVLRGFYRVLNPSVDREWLARERKRVGEAVYLREYGEWDTPPVWQPAILESWFGADVVQNCIDVGRREALDYEDGRRYHVAADAAFKRDAFAVAVATSEPGPLDESTGRRGPRLTFLVGSWAFKPTPGNPLSPIECVKRTTAICERYGALRCLLDQFGADPLRDLFRPHGIQTIELPWTATSKPAAFRMVRAAMLDGRIRLPDEPELIREFHNIRGTLLQSGGERIEAAHGVGDDRVHAAVMALAAALEAPPSQAEKNITWWERRQRAIAERRLATALGTAGHYLGPMGAD